MVNSCAACNCSSKYEEFAGIKFHSFPLKNEKRLKAWMQALRKKNFLPNNNSRLCSLHFRSDDYTNSRANNQPVLRKDAVPSVFDFTEHTPGKNSCHRVLESSSNSTNTNIMNKCIDAASRSNDNDGSLEETSKNVVVQTDTLDSEQDKLIDRLQRENECLRKKLHRRHKTDTSKSRKDIRKTNFSSNSFSKNKSNCDLELPKNDVAVTASETEILYSEDVSVDSVHSDCIKVEVCTILLEPMPKQQAPISFDDLPKSEVSQPCENELPSKCDLMNQKTVVHVEDRVCDSSQITFQPLDQLIENNSLCKETFICNYCAKPFSRKHSVKQHIEIQHMNKKPHICHECKKTFGRRTDLLRHHRMVHLKDPNFLIRFVCDVCGKNFPRKDTFTYHCQTHKTNPHFNTSVSCPVCQKQFSKASSLARHMMVIHMNQKRHVCNQCDKVFGHKPDLQRHQKTVHMKDPKFTRRFVCDYCGKGYQRNNNLIDHLRTHEQSIELRKPFSCDICELRFTQKSSLCCHKKVVHENKRPYMCNECRKTFSKKSTLLEHIRQKCHK